MSKLSAGLKAADGLVQVHSTVRGGKINYGGMPQKMADPFSVLEMPL